MSSLQKYKIREWQKNRENKELKNHKQNLIVSVKKGS